VLGKMAEMGQEAGSIPGMNPMDFFDNSSGLAQVMGISPGGLMGGGLFSNMTAVFTSNDANALVNAFGEQINDANDQVANGISMTTSFGDTAEAIGGVDAHRWSLQMLPDMGQPGAMQTQMMMQTLFGPSGLGGYIAATDDNTAIVTYSTKGSFVEKAINAAQNGGALATDQLLMIQADRLHDEPIMVAYIDGGAILNMTLPTLAMFGMAVNVDLPEHVTPLAMSLASQDGGVSYRTVVPTDFIDMVKQTAEAFGAMGGGMGGGEEPPPSF